MSRRAVLLVCVAGMACGPRGDAPTEIPPAAPVLPWVESEGDWDDTPARRAGPLDGFEAEVDAIMEAHDVPGLAIAIVHRGETVLAKGFGVREQGQPAKVDVDTTFAIASNTKAFVATAVGLLVADGTLKWDDPVRAHLPDLVLWDAYTTENLRVRDLLCHRSGLARWAGDALWIGSKIDTAGVLAKLRHVPPDYGLRERYGYSNLMFVVAGEVIRAKTGQSWDAFVRARLLEPLKMSRTTTSVDELKSQDNVASAHAKVPGGQQIAAYLDVDAAGASAALNSSVADMSRWLRMQLEGGELEGQRIVPAEIIDELRQPHTPIRRTSRPGRPKTGHFYAYGLGWVLLDVHGQLHVTHSGGLPGMTSRVLLVPEADLGIVVLTNNEASVGTYLARIAAARILGHDHADLLADATEVADDDAKPDAPTTDPTPPRAPTKAYAGTFRNPLLGRAQVTRDGDTLSLDLPDHGGLTCALVHRDGETFECAWKDATMGVSEVVYELRGKRAASLRFRIRPDFIDPLEYRFARR